MIAVARRRGRHEGGDLSGLLEYLFKRTRGFLPIESQNACPLLDRKGPAQGTAAPSRSIVYGRTPVRSRTPAVQFAPPLSDRQLSRAKLRTGP